MPLSMMRLSSSLSPAVTRSVVASLIPPDRIAKILERCRYYDGIYDGMGPCWTCKDDPAHCPSSDLPEPGREKP